MSHLRWCCAAALATVALGAADRAARAQTCTLELKRLEATSGKDLRAGPEQERPYRSVSSQSFTRQVGGGYPPDAEAEFRRIVKKEPAKYVSQEPFRSVARLGTGRFAFVLDAKDEKSKGYDRLYFDLNGSGDLTDDKPIDAVADRSPRAVGQPGYTYHQFPRADLSIPVEGKRLEYSFRFSANSYASANYRSVSAYLLAAAYRVGEITLEGEKHNVALLDYNSNGRFDDQIAIEAGVQLPGGRIYARGDMVLVDPAKVVPSNEAGFAYGNQYRQHLSKLLRIGDKFYDVKVSPTGDRLTLTPSKLKVGYLSNPSGPSSAVIFGDHGFLPIRFQQDGPTAVPEGQWKLLSYRIVISGWKPPPDKKEEPKPGQKDADKERLCEVTAFGTDKGAAVTVRAGKTATMPFGPPYKPVVEANVGRWEGGAEVKLSMSLVGCGGEAVDDLMIDGHRPPKPEIIIRDPEGQIVEKGSLEYG